MLKKVFFKNSQGQKLAGVLNIPDKPGIFPGFLRFHGYNGNKEGTSKVFQEKLKDDFVSLIFEYHAHGESEGDFEDFSVTCAIDDCQSALRFLLAQEKVDKNKIALAGASLGGMLGLLTAAKNPFKVLAVACPVVDFKATFSANENMALWKKQGWIHPLGDKNKKIKYAFFEEGIRYNIYKEAEKINCQVFIISGDKDEYIPVEHLKKLTKHLKKPTLEIIKGANHRFEKDYNYYIDQSIKFLKENL